jgi:copper chaperone CopZ
VRYLLLLPLLLAPPAAAAGAPMRLTACEAVRSAVLRAAVGAPAANWEAALPAAARSDSPLQKAPLEVPEVKSEADAAAVVAGISALPGVHSALVDARTRLAVVDFDPRLTDLAAILAACRRAGFEAAEYRVESRFPKPVKLKGG